MHFKEEAATLLRLFIVLKSEKFSPIGNEQVNIGE